MKSPLIAPSVLAADFGRLNEEMDMINRSEADWFHIDIMDGVFVPNISFGFPICESIRAIAQKPMDVHLMIVKPELYVERFADLGASVISVHFEACPHLHRNIQQIKKLGCKAGVAINPHTPVSLLEDVIQDIDLVCLMSVNPGYGGQSFINQTFTKVRQLKELIIYNEASTLIEIDGGVNAVNAVDLVNAGADVLVAGSFVFQSEDPLSTISDLKSVGQ